MKYCHFKPMGIGSQPGWETIPCAGDAVLFRKCDGTEGDFTGLDHDFSGFGYNCIGRSTVDGNLTAVYADEKAVYTLSYAPHESICRLVVDSATAVPDNLASDSAQSETASLCDVQVTQLRLLYCSADCGMGYLIRLADGRFVMIDCGVGEYDEAEHLLDLLEAGNVLPGKPTIAAWFITHPHGDHFGTFVRLIEKYSHRFTLETLAYNWPTREMAGGFSDLTGFDAVLTKLQGTKIITPRAGWCLTYPGVTFQVLFACEDLYPIPYRDINNTSLVMRMDVGDQRFLWLGDCSGQASEYICQRYTPETLRCRFLQVGHHGYWGGSERLYSTVDPAVLFWPCPDFWYQVITHWDCNKALVTSEHIHTVYVSGRQEVTVTLGAPLPDTAPETPSDTNPILAEDFTSTNVFAKGWASITGGQTGYSGMKLLLTDGSGHFSAGERRALCELVRPDLMPDSYRVTLSVTDMQGEVGLVYNHDMPTVWDAEKYHSFAGVAVPCTLTLETHAVEGKCRFYRNDTLVQEIDYTPAPKHGLYLTVQNGFVTVGKILVEKRI